MAPGANIQAWEREFERETREAYSRRKDVAKKLKIKKGMAIADVGAGTGLMLEIFSKGVGKKGKVYAVDIAPPFIEHMKKRVAKEGWTNVEVVHSKPDTTTLPDASVDIVYTGSTWHHVQKRPEMLADIKRILKPGGALWVLDFDRREDASTAWVLGHLKESRADLVASITANGFKEEGSPPPRFLGENFLARFVPAE
jgi:ubiquinone/menaquinone biosynthesis C-methylase UbiE